MFSSFPWYQNIENSDEILQGDFVINCPIVIPPNNFEGEQEMIIQELDTIVLSQSCDIQNGKIDIILVCPYYNLDMFLSIHPTSKDGSKKSRLKVIDNLKQGVYPSYHLLQKDEKSGIDDYLVVDFRNVYGVNYNFLKKYILKITKRNRILPPYREHMSQAFARYFMRVGLPIILDAE